MMNFSSPEFKVGSLLVIVSFIVGGMALKVSSGVSFFSNSDDYWFDISDAGGLVKGSSIRMAGIPVGQIDSIRLVNGKARVFLKIDEGTPIKTSSEVRIYSDGILGDRHVGIQSGSPKDPEHDPSKGLKVLESASKISDVVSKMSRMSELLSSVARNLNTATSGEGDPDSPIGRIILSIEKLTVTLSSIVVENEDKLKRILSRVESISQNMDEFFDSSNPEGLRVGWAKISSSIESLNDSLGNVKEITGKINRGEGTLGRLINDDETVENINFTIENINRFLGGVGETQTTFDYHGEYSKKTDEFKNYISLRLTPGLDRYYQFGLVADSKGTSVEEVIERDTDGVETVISEKKTFKDKLKISAVMGKRFYDLTVKGGIMENTGGVGLDYHFLDKDLQFSVEAFGFDDLNVKAFAKYNIFKGVYIKTGGGRLSSDTENSFFVGGGIFITNEDLKVLAGQLGSFAR